MMSMQRSGPAIGSIVAGRYRIEAELGRGGHGVVYRATQQPLGHEIALKMLLPEAILAEGSVERFMREAALAQKLTHPNTVRLFDFGQTEQGLPFIVWELLRGRTLDQEIARGPFTAQRTARVATQVLKSLMEAHACGIVHRDIKPQNVFLGDHPGETDFVKVLDFGVATTLPGAGGGPPVTRSGQMIGTPNYMAPEQVNGGLLSPRTDLYALGLVMAEALSGYCVVNDTSPVKVWMMQASPSPVALPQIVSHSILGAVIVRATRKNPEERYASAEEMLVDLDRSMHAATAATDPLQKPLHPTMPLGGAHPSAPTAPAQMFPQATPNPTPLAGPQQPYDSTMRSPGQPTPLQNASATSAPPLTPSPYTPPPAPTPIPSQMVASQQTSTLSGLIVVAIIGLFIVILGLAGIVGFFLYRAASATANFPTNRPVATSSGGKGSSVHMNAGSLKKVDRAYALARVKADGWSIMSDSQTKPTPGFDVVTIMVSRAPHGGSIQIYNYDSPSVADQTEEALLKTPDSALARDGTKIVFVAIFGSHAASVELLTTLVN